MHIRRPGLSKRMKLRCERGGIGTFTGSGGLYAINEQLVAVPFAGPYIAPTLAGGVLAGGGAWLATKMCRTTYPPDDDLDIRMSTPREIELIHEALSKLTDGRTVPLQEKLDMHKRNPRCFRSIFHDSERGRDKTLVGKIIIYPLRKWAWEQVLAGEIEGRHVRAQHLVSRWRSASGVYVSYAEGDGLATKGFVVRELERILEAMGCPVATRTASKDSLRLAKTLGMKGIDGSEPALKTVCWADWDTLKRNRKKRGNV